jgi:hypothetical protein
MFLLWPIVCVRLGWFVEGGFSGEGMMIESDRMCYAKRRDDTF